MTPAKSFKNGSRRFFYNLVRPMNMHAEDRQHYLCVFLMSQKKCWVIWYNGEIDGLVVNASGKVMCFSTPELARAYANRHAIELEDKPPAQYDFDRLERWTRRRAALHIDCVEFLNAWNMLSDVLASTGGSPRFSAQDSRMNQIYEKLFYGNNLPSVTPRGRRYVPRWSSQEMGSLAQLLRVGIHELRRVTSA